MQVTLKKKVPLRFWTTLEKPFSLIRKIKYRDKKAQLRETIRLSAGVIIKCKIIILTPVARKIRYLLVNPWTLYLSKETLRARNSLKVPTIRTNLATVRAWVIKECSQAPLIIFKRKFSHQMQQDNRITISYLLGCCISSLKQETSKTFTSMW